MFKDYYQMRYRSPPGAGRKTEIQVKVRKTFDILSYSNCV